MPMTTLPHEALTLRHSLLRIRIWKQIGAHLEIAGMEMLLRVALEEGQTVRELSKLCGLSQSSGSRWVLYWGVGRWAGSQRRRNGLGYVEARVDPMDSRVKRVYLTDKGRGFIQSLLAEERTMLDRATAARGPIQADRSPA